MKVEESEGEQMSFTGQEFYQQHRVVFQTKQIIIFVSLVIFICIFQVYIFLPAQPHYNYIKPSIAIHLNPRKSQTENMTINFDKLSTIGKELKLEELNDENKLKLASAKQLITRYQIQKERKSRIEKQPQKIQNEEVETSQSPKNERQKYKYKAQMKDFEKEEAYEKADPEIRAIFDEMIKRQQNRHDPLNQFFMPTQKAYFALRLFEQPKNKRYQKAEYYYLNYKYKIGDFKDELPLCIVAPGRNLNAQAKYKRFIQSIIQQNYTNYKLVYIDDASDDGTPSSMKDFIQNQLKEGHLNEDGRFIIVQNSQRVYALGNRNNGIRNHCKEEDIVLDVDADDSFIGIQAFKFINAIFHNSDLWMSNSVFIYMDKIHHEVSTGVQDGVPQDLLQTNRYRGSMVWKTSELRAFRSKLFRKINQNDFKDENGKFYQWASDAFIMEPLIELSGPEHYHHFYQIFYFYDWDMKWKNLYLRRHYRDIAWTQTPYNPLNSLEEEATKEQNYEISHRMKLELNRNIKKAREEAKENGRSIDI